jgi:YtkA-like
VKPCLIIFCLFLLLNSCKPLTTSSGSTKLPEGVQVQLEVGDAPKTGNLPVSVYILKNNQAISGATVSVTGNMTHPGMTPVIVTAKESEVGLYKADPFVIEMPGDAVITAEVTLSDGTKFTVNKALTVTQSP